MNVVIFFHCQNLPTSESDISVTFIAPCQRLRGAGVKGLKVDLLIGFVDERHCNVGQAERASAIFIDPAASAETIRGQACDCAVVPAPDARSRVLRAELIPEKAGRTDAQFGEIDACRHCLGGREQIRILR